MDKFEYKVRADEIKELISEGNYAEAAEIADSIDWRRVKSVMMLCMISDLYKINKRYEDAKNMLLLAYDRRPGGRTICYSLCELCLKTGDFLQAVNYFNEFVQASPDDPGRFVLKYKMLEAQDASVEERIQILQELKSADYREKWAYELAYLYHIIGNATQCVDECDELILWFGDGKYVIKAMELKMQHCVLTPEQQEKYDRRFARPVKKAEAEQQPEAEGRPETEEKPVAEENPKAEEKPVTAGNPEQEIAATWAVMENAADHVSESIPEVSNEDAEQVREELMVAGQDAEQVSGEDEIHVKTVDVGEYNTINLQAEVAAGLRALLGEENPSRTIVASALQEESAPKQAGDITAAGDRIESTEVFFGETGELSQVQVEAVSTHTGDMCEVILPEETAAEVTATEEEPVVEIAMEETVLPAEDTTAQIVMEQMRMEGAGEAVSQVMAAEPPKALANVLSQESDGQIRIVIPERESVEKQITGQMNIEDILAEWERMKQESEEKRKEEVRRHVLQQTGTMFTEFEASVRDGLLEKLESGEATDVDELLASEGYGAEESETDEPEEAITEEFEAEEVATEEFEAEETATEESEAEEVATEEFEMEEAATEEFETEEAATEESEAEEVATEEFEMEEAATEEFEMEEAAAEEFETEEAATEEFEAEEAATEEFEMEEAVEENPGEISTDELEAIFEEVDAEDIAEIEEIIEEAEREADESEDDASAQPKVRSLTREERELYGPFIQGRTARERLVKAVDAISMAAYTGNIIITGEEGMDTMLLAKNMMREVQMSDSNFSGKVAKVSGEGLNRRDVEDTVKQLANGGLIIQKASDMSEETASKLSKLLQKENFGIVVVLEDTKKGISHLFASCPKLSASFTARMDVEALSNASLAAFGKKYARELEFAIDDVGMLALHMRIEALQTIDHAVTVVEVKEIVDEAIRRAKKKTLKHFVDILFAKRYDDEDMIILTEKDFA